MLKVLRQAIITDDGTAPPAGSDLAAVAAAAMERRWKAVVAKKRTMSFWAIGIMVGAVVAIVLAAIGLSGGNEELAVSAAVVGVLGLIGGGVLLATAENLQPAKRVVSVSKVYWPVVAFPLEGRTVLYDAGGVYPNQRITLQLLNQPDRLRELSTKLETLMGDLSVLEPSEEALNHEGTQLFGIDAALTRTLLELRETLADTSKRQMDVPAIPAQDPVVGWLQTMCPRFVEADASPVVAAANANRLADANAGIEGVYKASDSAELYDIDDKLAELESYTDVLMDTLEEAHRASVALIHSAYTLASHTTAWPSLYFYCPLCNATEGEGDGGGETAGLLPATRLHEDVESGWLRCPQCSGGFPVEHAIIRTRLRQESFIPAFDQILLTLREEILRIDRDVENQLVQLEKERRVKLQEVKMNVVQEQRKRLAQLRRYKSQANALSAQVLGMTAALLRYKKVASDRALQFRSDCERIVGEVEKKTAEAVAKIETEFKAREAQALQEAAQISAIKKAEEEHRHQDVMEAHEKAAKIAMMTEEEKDSMRSKGLGEINPFTHMKRSAASRRAGAAATRVS